MVSISCITYNYEKYIRQCLDSLLMQKTNFKYEIFVHDYALLTILQILFEIWKKVFWNN